MSNFAVQPALGGALKAPLHPQSVHQITVEISGLLQPSLSCRELVVGACRDEFLEHGRHIGICGMAGCCAGKVVMQDCLGQGPAWVSFLGEESFPFWVCCDDTQHLEGRAQVKEYCDVGVCHVVEGPARSEDVMSSGGGRLRVWGLEGVFGGGDAVSYRQSDIFIT